MCHFCAPPCNEQRKMIRLENYYNRDTEAERAYINVYERTRLVLISPIFPPVHKLREEEEGGEGDVR